jgi:hypothetical protein
LEEVITLDTFIANKILMGNNGYNRKTPAKKSSQAITEEQTWAPPVIRRRGREIFHAAAAVKF